MKVLRDGALLDLKYQLKQRRPLVPILHGVDCVPSYFIVGGLVFVPLSIPFLEHAYGGMSLFDLGERQVFAMLTYWPYPPQNIHISHSAALTWALCVTF